MKTPVNQIVKIAFLASFLFLSSIGSNLLITKPAQALTWPEVGKLFGIWNRYIEDIQKTMYDQPQPTQSIDPEDPTAPASDDLDKEFESIITK